MKPKILVIIIAILFTLYPQNALKAHNKLDVPYWDLILEYSTRYEIDPYLVAALVNRESRFDKKAVSYVGALGLTQMMPSTAKFIAKELGYDKYDLFNPEVSIHFGVYYLRKLISQYKTEYSALRSYNGGPYYMKRFQCHRYANEIVRQRDKYTLLASTN